MILRTIFIIAVLLLIDLYVFQGVRVIAKNLSQPWSRMLIYGYWSISIICCLILGMGAVIDWHQWPKPLRTYSFAFVFVIYFSKLFLIVFLLLDDILRIFRWIISFFQKPSAGDNVSGGGISRSDFIVKLGMLVAAIPFVALIVGMFRGKYEYQVRKVRLALAGLPDSFRGFRIVQISDIHTGSFMNRNPLAKAVKMVNELKPDAIFFTGDLVNDHHREALPYTDILSGLKAEHGVFSILGNHDYGDYYRWKSHNEKTENLHQLIRLHKKLGWDILLDEHRYIEKNDQRIGLIGVQNWSARMNFTRYGNLEKALEGMHHNQVNILLSHDPSHWKAQVLGKVKDIQLTLSGHTHGFQFGVEIPGFRWSPVQYVYKEWCGLYSENGQHLYVNRGLGFLGYPGRVGILPEITVFELDKA